MAPAQRKNRPRRGLDMSMAVTNTQQGVITEAEFAKVVMLTSDGRLVPARPLADDDRRDFEIHIRRHFLEILEDLARSAARGQRASDLISLPGVVWLGEPGLTLSVKRRRAG